MELYGSKTEKEDLEFLKRKGYVTNPADIKEKLPMIHFINLLREHDVVYYRISYRAWGVAFEVVSALAFEIPVYSLETKRKISKKRIKEIVEIFKNSPHFEEDVEAFKNNFTEDYAKFLKVVNGA